MRTIRTPVISLISAAVLSACSMAPDYQQPQNTLPAQYELATAARTDMSWQTLLPSKAMQQLVTEVQQQHRTLAQSRAALAQLAARYQLQQSSQWPTLNAAATSTRQGLPGDLSGTGQRQVSSQHSATVGLTAFELDLFGAAQNQTESALQQYYAGEAELRATELAISSEFISHYLQAQQQAQLLALAERQLQTVTLQAHLVQQRLQAGLVDELTYQTAAREQAAAQTVAVEGRAQLATARHQLEADLHRPLTATEWLTITEQVDSLADLPAGTPSDLLLKRPDVIAAEHQLRATNANIGVARAAFFPSISLTSQIGTASSQFSSLFGNGSSYWQIAPQVNLPLWDFGARKANVEQAELAQTIAISTYLQRVELAFREVADQLTIVQSGQQQLQASKAQQQHALQVLQLTNQRQAIGVDNQLQRLDAERSWYTAATTQTNQYYQLQQARLGLFKAMGGSYHPPAEPTR